ncbi:unnamed protein product [Cyclocybe aegerita]|uniref:Uncharacterized protein n=1 Tax=Cyclocybe aegerita TaxID=1973307 RepID=A0A8S0W5Z5_CYCAE|nr:unnamed protein product [Cyclocybe aegerita]
MKRPTLSLTNGCCPHLDTFTMAPMSPRIFAPLLLALLLGLQFVSGSPVTLYVVDQPLSDDVDTVASIEQGFTMRFSALGPGEDGMTRYAQEVVRSRLVLHAPDETRTLLNEPVTLYRTFEQGATQEKASNPLTIATHGLGHLVWQGLDSTCSLDIPNNRGSCVEVVENARVRVVGDPVANPSFTTSISTYTTTYTGALQPLVTIDPESTTAPTPTPTTSGALSSAVGSSLVLVIGAITGMTVLFL